jgi:DNA-binding transcriptional LysR family regulator
MIGYYMLNFHEASIRKLKVFTTVVDCGGFSAAQSALGTSAATISVQMKELEEQLGMVLCQRGRSGFRLTDQGRAVNDAARDMFGAFGNFNLTVASIRDTLIGEVKIGLQANIATNPEFHLPQAMRQFHARPNKVTFRLEEARSADQEAYTLDGRFDLSIGLFPNQLPGLVYEPLFSERVTLYCAPDHPLARTGTPAQVRELLASSAFVSAGPGQHQLMKQNLGLPEPSAIAENMDAAVMLIRSGQYVGFLPDHFANFWQNRGRLYAVLPDKFGTEVDFKLITRRGARDKNVVDAFVSELLAAHRF